MANKVNNWEQLLELANKDLKQHGVEMNVILVEETGDYDLHIIYPDGTTDFFAENYYEDELGDLINDAWAHARAKAKSETIYSEVKCTHHEDGFWVVDAWKTNVQEEEGIVIAVINDVTGECYAIRDLNDKAKGVIDEKQTEIVAQRPEILAEIYNSMTDAEKDEFLRLTENQ